MKNQNETNIFRLTAKEEEVMNHFWVKGELFVRELLNMYDDPKPHFNTLSTIVRGLEEKGYIGHQSFGNTYRYYPLISKEDYKKGALMRVVNKYFKSSYLGVVSSLIEEEEISIDELKMLIKRVEETNKAK
ncbi:MAG: transcriptional regulator [Bacteroidetes bacterium 41-46]|jgi:predicted transcriptional regulator|nr:MAG: transcriptional regulator [Bacteroidetes bacterium 41-46]